MTEKTTAPAHKVQEVQASMDTMRLAMGIEKLDGTNYTMWCFDVQIVLEELGLWGIIDGSEAEPPKTDAEGYRKYEVRSQKCRRALVLTMKAESKRLIMELTTAKQIWEKLERVYRPRTRQRKIRTYREFGCVTVKEDEDLQDYVNRVRHLAVEMEKAGCQAPSDETISLSMLAGLTREYDFIVALADTFSDDNFTSQNIEALIVGEYRRRQYTMPGSEPSSASREVMVAASKPIKRKSPKKRQDRNKESRRCYNCSEVGHLAVNCSKPKKSSPKKSKKVSMVAVKNEVLTCTTVSKKKSSKIPWIIDCAASMSLTPVRSDYHEFKGQPKTRVADLADSSPLTTAGIGSVLMKSRTCGILLRNVHYAPKVHSRIISAGALSRVGVKFVIDGARMTATRKQKLLFEGHRLDNNLFEVKDLTKVSSTTGPTSVLAVQGLNATELWHERLGHPSYEALREMKVKGLVRGLEEVVLEKPMSRCEACQKGKSAKLSFGTKTVYRAKERLDLVHSDVCGPLPVVGVGGAKYFVTFTDDFSRKTWVFMLRSKDKVLEAFKRWKAQVENEVGLTVKRLRTDNGREYVNHSFDAYLAVAGIIHQRTNVYSPQENGVAERVNRTLLNTARTLLEQAKLDKILWPEAVLTANYLKNARPTKALEATVPCEAWARHKPSVRHLRRFGCKVFVTVPSQKRGKLDARAVVGYFVGYPSQGKGYHVWFPAQRKVERFRDVRFEEQELYSAKATEEVRDTSYEEFVFFPTPELVGDNGEEALETREVDEMELGGAVADNLDVFPDQNADVFADEEVFPESDDDEDGILVPDPPQELEPLVPVAPVVVPQVPQGRELRPRAQLTRPKRYLDVVQELDEPVEPATFAEAMSGPDSAKWKKAVEEEYASLEKLKVFELVDLPEGRKAVGHKWVLKLKRDPNGKVQRFKARLVAQGFRQRFGVDYNETYSPVAGLNVVRLFIAAAMVKGWKVHQTDLETAYLNGELEDEIYLTQPQGFVVKGQENKVWRLKKSLYGLKQSGRCWNQTMNKKFVGAGLKRSEIDPCVYYGRLGAKRSIVCVFVDDDTVISEDDEGVTEVKKLIASLFRMKDMGEIHYMLGVKMTMLSDGCEWNQTSYVNKVIKRFNMDECKVEHTPLAASQVLSKDQCPKTEEERAACASYPYRELIGSLMYVAQGTRPDISYAVSKLGQFSSNPGKVHWSAGKRVLRYLKKTAHFSLKLKNERSVLTAYVDADWAGDLDDRKSRTGYCLELGGSPIHWSSVKQTCIAASTMESEYVALATCAREVLWVRNILKEVGLEDLVGRSPTIIWCDNQAAVQCATDPVPKGGSRHIDIRFHMVRNAVAAGDLEVKYVSTSENKADILTKSLARDRHEKLVRSLQLGPPKAQTVGGNQ